MADVPPAVSAYFSQLGKRFGAKGGKVRAAKMGPEALKAHADRMNAAKAAKKKARAEALTVERLEEDDVDEDWTRYPP